MLYTNVSVLACMEEGPTDWGKARRRELFSQPKMNSVDIPYAPIAASLPCLDVLQSPIPAPHILEVQYDSDSYII